MTKISYQLGVIDDLASIAELHALSWKVFYRGILSDEYLDNEVDEDRLSVWQQRFGKRDPSMTIITAKLENHLIGFACHFLHYHETYGHYLDNLHVHPDYRGRGIGKLLLEKSITHCSQFRDSNYYLWVFDKNQQAINFYEKNNGRKVLKETFATPDGLSEPALLYSWNLNN